MLMHSSSRSLAAVATAVLLLASATAARAQYFGQNKVQYKDLKFQVLKTEHFDIYFYPGGREGAVIASRMAERWYARLSRLLEHQLRGRQPLILYASHTDFEQTNAIAGDMGEGTGGVTEPLRRRIVLPMGGPLADTDHVIGHELVHAFQFDMTSGPNSMPGQNGAEQLPLWFIEGMAEYFSIGPVDPNTTMWLRDAAREDKIAEANGKKKAENGLPEIKDLDNPKYFPYRWGQALWAYIGGRWGDDVIRQLLILGGRGGASNLDELFKRILGEDEKQISADWKAAIHQAYDPILARTTPPAEIGRMVIKATTLDSLNVGPSISPDGKYLAFLSERSFFAIDLYVADAATGKILHRLTSNATNPHFSSIQFIYSAGAWSADSKQIAIATVTNGRAAIALFDVQSGTRVRDIPVPDVDEVFNPTWAPDGHALCFTGMKQGLTDLWVLDLGSGHVLRLTNDAYADLMPAWSPDGSRVAFTTDRFSSNLTTLAIGPYRLATIDPQTGRIDQVPAFTDGKNINPQWAPDGRSLFFVSDRDGIPNLYRITMPGGEITQLTKVGTGLTGITSSSPTLSVASKAGIAAFSVYENDKYDVFTLDAVNAVSTAELSAANDNAAVLPPINRKPSIVAALVSNPMMGLPPATTPIIEPYKAKLTLEGVSQPTIAVGADQFGAAIGGGISMIFGDMLGDHMLGVAAQVNQGIGNGYSFNDTAAEVQYLNMAHRWNWGVTGAQIPYIAGGFFNPTLQTTPAGDLVETDQTVLYRQTERSAAFLTQYPLNRARRVELQGGVTQMSFDAITQTTQYSLYTGQVYNNSVETTTLAAPIVLGTASAAFVSDTSNFGATSPVSGERYRVSVGPNFGTINYTELLADYRRYFMPAPFYTIAVRAIQYGRYGSGSEDSRLFPLFLGYPGLVRGYDYYSFNSNECVPTATDPCPAFDRLMGSRVLVGNIELRFPLLRPFTGVSQNMYGPVPAELAFFADAGGAWDAGQRPFSSEHPGVSSVGATVRLNLMGYVPLEFDFARPLQRPGVGWVFQFNISPGF